MTYSQFCLYLSRNIWFSLLCHLVAYCLLYRKNKPKSSNPEYELHACMHAKKQQQNPSGKGKEIVGRIDYFSFCIHLCTSNKFYLECWTSQTDLEDGLWIKWKWKPSETLLYDGNPNTKCRMWTVSDSSKSKSHLLLIVQ